MDAYFNRDHHGDQAMPAVEMQHAEDFVLATA